jgi:hypothetical protein
MLPTAPKRRILDARWQRPPPGGEEIEMFELGILVLAVVGACWLFGALIGGLFKLTFGLLGALIGGLFGLFLAGLVVLLVVPIVLFALLPLMLPALCIAALVWLIVRASQPRDPEPTAH